MSDYILRTLESFCVGRAEAEESFLMNAFVLGEHYQEALHAPFHSPVILLGRKGTGKTALLKYLHLRSTQSGIKALYLKPDDMPLLEGIGDAEETATIKRKAYQALVSAVATKIGSELRGLLGKSDKKLFDKALSDGARSHDAVQACLHGLAQFGSTVTDIKFDQLIPDSKGTSHIALQKSLKDNFAKTDKAFLLLLDDVDQVAAIANCKQINRIWGFILAAQRLTEELPNLKTIVSLRTEIWAILERDEHGQRDQVDHVRRLLKRIDPTDDEMKRIITRRLEVVADHCGLPLTDGLDRHFFEEQSVTLPTADVEQRSWQDFLVKSSRGRPRDAIQLLSHLSESSRLSGCDRISTTVVDDVATRYSTQLVEDLAREYARDCAVMRELVNSFANVDFLMTADALRGCLMSTPSHFGLTIRGQTIHRESVSDIFILWRFVHEVGLWNPRFPDAREGRCFRHLMFDQNPSFVSEANWNEMQKAAWELHPAYRSHLIELKRNEKARAGLSLASFFKKKV
jgi:Cdc6-like AAA superfamily ATPase